jgi:hypothetical protein
MNYKLSLSVGNIPGGGNNLLYAVKELSKNIKWEQGSERNILWYSNWTYGDYVSFDGTTIEDAVSAAKKYNVKVSILGENHVEENINMLIVVNESGGEAIGNNYNKIVLNKAESETKPEYFSKTFKLNENSEYTLVVINGTVYGVSDKDKIVIRKLDKNRVNNIVFLEYDFRGVKINQREYKFGTEKTPDSGVIKF